VRISLGSSCLGEALFGVLENGFDLLAGHPREPSQEVIYARPAFEVLEEGLDRHARALEEPGSADLCRIPFDRRTVTPIEHGSRLTQWLAERESAQVPQTFFRRKAFLGSLRRTSLRTLRATATARRAAAREICSQPG